jgi:AcrR family transcriptional regulator
MAQVKKDDVRAAILRGADALFRERGYSAATLRSVAKRSKVSLANIYAYYDSKFEIMFALYEPWFVARLERLEAEALEIHNRPDRLRMIITSLWRDMPTEYGGMAVSLMQALSAAMPTDHYDPGLISWAEEKIGRLLINCISTGRDIKIQTYKELAHILFMAFDGFAINQRLDPKRACTDLTIDVFCRLIAMKGSSASKYAKRSIPKMSSGETAKKAKAHRHGPAQRFRTSTVGKQRRAR